jgi:hypothetical protein
MSRRNRWIGVLFAAIAVAGGALVLVGTGQLSTQRTVSLEDIYALLVTEDGQNRLDLIDEKLTDLDDEVDLIYLQAKEMMEAEGWQFDKQSWTLDDVKFLLDIINAEINAIQDRLELMPPCP